MQTQQRFTIALCGLAFLVAQRLGLTQVDTRLVVEDGKTLGVNSKKEESRFLLRILDKKIAVPLKAGLDAAAVSALIEAALKAALVSYRRIDTRTLELVAGPPAIKGVAFAIDDAGLRVTASATRTLTSTLQTKVSGQAFRCPRNGPVTRTETVLVTLVREVAGKRISSVGSVTLSPSDSGSVSTQKLVDEVRRLGGVVQEVVWLGLFDNVEAPFINIDRTTRGEPVVGLSFQPDLHDIGLMASIERVVAERPRFGFADFGVGFAGGLSSAPWIEGVGTMAPNGQVVTVSHMVAGNSACVRVIGSEEEGLDLGGPQLLVKPLIVLGFASQADGTRELRIPVPNDAGLIGAQLLMQDFAVLGSNRLASTPGLAAVVGR